jgi:hypothetical protein
VTLQHSAYRRPLVRSREVDQAYDSGVRPLEDYGQLAEVLVEGHQHTPLGPRPRKDVFVTRGRRVVANPRDVNAAIAKLRNSAAPDAGVEQQRYALRFRAIVSTVW